MSESRPQGEPKHPYVTVQNAKFHLGLAITMTILAIIQVCLGISVSEKIVKLISNQMMNKGSCDMGYNNYYSSQDNWFYGDEIWPAGLSIVLAALGFSVYHTRARANGIMLSVVSLAGGFVAYPVAIGLGAGLMGNNECADYELYDSIISVRYGSVGLTVIQALLAIIWGFYSAGHACCNSRVHKERRMNLPAGTAVQQPQQYPGPQIVYVNAPAGYPGNPAPAGYPGNPAPAGYPGNPAPAGYPGNPAPAGYTQAGYPGGAPVFIQTGQPVYQQAGGYAVYPQQYPSTTLQYPSTPASTTVQYTTAPASTASSLPPTRETSPPAYGV